MHSFAGKHVCYEWWHFGDALICRYTRMLRMMTLRWCTHLPVYTYATNDDIAVMHSFAGKHVCYEWWHCGDALICRYTRMLRMMTLRWCTHLPVYTYATNDDIAVMHSFAGKHVCYEWWHCGDALICRYTRMLRMMTLRWCTHLPVYTYATNDDIAVMHSFAGIHVCYEWWHCGDALIWQSCVVTI